MNAPDPSLFPGACYKFTVRSAAEAVELIRERLGPAARVLSVRAVPAKGWRRLVGSPQLEVIAQIDSPAPAAAPAAAVPAGYASTLASEPLESSAVAATADAPLVAARLAPPASVGLAGLLRRSGLGEGALSRLQSGANWGELNTMPLHRALAETARQLREQIESRPGRAPLSRAAFLGTAGVGRTTALCKWLSAEVFRRARLGHVVTVEFDRPNPSGPLPVFAEALGVPLAHFPCGTRPAVPGGFVYFDLPGLSVRRPADNRPLAEWLDREEIKERVLVLNAAYDRASLRDAYTAGRDLGATHLVFTHLDEVPQWGRLWDFLFDEQIEPLFLGTGPSLTGDCEEDVPGAIVRRTLPDA
ncbi:MAG TPA: flagellar GTP-binding protein [Opitutaceae bacterium]